MIGYFKNTAVDPTTKGGLMELAASAPTDEYAEDFYDFIVTRYYLGCKGTSDQNDFKLPFKSAVSSSNGHVKHSQLQAPFPTL